MFLWSGSRWLAKRAANCSLWPGCSRSSLNSTHGCHETDLLLWRTPFNLNRVGIPLSLGQPILDRLGSLGRSNPIIAVRSVGRSIEGDWTMAGGLAIVLSGGGAKGAFQVGVLTR